MFFPDLPPSTKIDKSIPKNKFYSSCTTKQKSVFVEKINKIIWRNTLSVNTINVKGKVVDEILILEIQLKEKAKINDIILLINKLIPYHVIFYVTYLDDFFISTSIRHTSYYNENNSVIDRTFNTEWENDINKYKINLFNNLDLIYLDFCNQLLQISKAINSFEKLIEIGDVINKLKNNILNLESQINNCRQFNKKVELNSQLKKLQQELKRNYVIS